MSLFLCCKSIWYWLLLKVFLNIILCSSKGPIWNHNLMSCLFFTFRKVLVIRMTPLLMMDTVSENGMSPQQNMERYSLNILLVFLWNDLVRQTHKSFWNILWPCCYCMFTEYLMAMVWSLVVNYLTPANEWPRENFSLQYQYNMRQASDENKKNITKRIVSWSNTKFSELTWSELYGRQ